MTSSAFQQSPAGPTGATGPAGPEGRDGLEGPAGPPGASGGLVKLADVTLGVAGPSLDTGANGIAAGYSALLVKIITRVTTASILDAVSVQFNGDGGNNYTYEDLFSVGSGVAGSKTNGTSALGLDTLGSAASANVPGVITLDIPAYADTTFAKAGIAIAGAVNLGDTNGVSKVKAFVWNNTAAINQIAVLHTNIVAGSRLIVYGVI